MPLVVVNSLPKFVSKVLATLAGVVILRLNEGCKRRNLFWPSTELLSAFAIRVEGLPPLIFRQKQLNLLGLGYIILNHRLYLFFELVKAHHGLISIHSELLHGFLSLK